MPIYEFVCESCGFKTEILTNVQGRNKKFLCEICGKKLKRAYSNFNTKHLVIHSDKPPTKQHNLVID